VDARNLPGLESLGRQLEVDLICYSLILDETHVSEQCGLTDLNYWRDNSIMYS
jgi:hypothetical protein